MVSLGMDNRLFVILVNVLKTFKEY